MINLCCYLVSFFNVLLMDILKVQFSDKIKLLIPLFEVKM